MNWSWNPGTRPDPFFVRTRIFWKCFGPECTLKAIYIYICQVNVWFPVLHENMISLSDPQLKVWRLVWKLCITCRCFTLSLRNRHCEGIHQRPETPQRGLGGCRKCSDYAGKCGGKPRISKSRNRQESGVCSSVWHFWKLTNFTNVQQDSFMWVDILCSPCW